jgi:DNA-binding FadR family transcriptional regulator
MPRRKKTGKPLRLHGEIAREIGVNIVSGRYKPGQLLEGEIEASDHLHVSRTVYREALRILVAKGLVASRPKVGTVVSPQSTWHLLDPDVLSWVFESEPEDGFLNDLFELRRMIEPSAAALAAQRRTESDIEEIERALNLMADESLATEGGREADLAFHSAILRATRNVFLVSLTSGVCAAIAWTTIFKQRDKALPRDPIPDHRRVFDAIAAGNANAAYAAMSTLVDLALADTMAARSGPKATNKRR